MDGLRCTHEQPAISWGLRRRRRGIGVSVTVLLKSPKMATLGSKEFLKAQMSVFMAFCGPVGGGRKQIGRQVEGFPLFGCAAASGRGIQCK